MIEEVGRGTRPRRDFRVGEGDLIWERRVRIGFKLGMWLSRRRRRRLQEVNWIDTDSGSWADKNPLASNGYGLKQAPLER